MYNNYNNNNHPLNIATKTQQSSISILEINLTVTVRVLRLRRFVLTKTETTIAYIALSCPFNVPPPLVHPLYPINHLWKTIPIPLTHQIALHLCPSSISPIGLSLEWRIVLQTSFRESSSPPTHSHLSHPLLLLCIEFVSCDDQNIKH